MRHTRALCTALLALAAALLPPAAAAQTYALDWQAVVGGGATGGAGGAYALDGAAGQPDVDTSAGGSYSMTAGFWVIAGAGPTLTPTATITPGGPTLTATATITPGGPTLTATATITPGGPTLTPTATITPGGPTLTPTASPAAVGVGPHSGAAGSGLALLAGLCLLLGAWRRLGPRRG